MNSPTPIGSTPTCQVRRQGAERCDLQPLSDSLCVLHSPDNDDHQDLFRHTVAPRIDSASWTFHHMRFPIPLGIEARHFSSLSIHRTQFSSAFTLENCEVAEFLSFSYVRFHGPVSFHNSVFRGRSVVF